MGEWPWKGEKGRMLPSNTANYLFINTVALEKGIDVAFFR